MCVARTGTAWRSEEGLLSTARRPTLICLAESGAAASKAAPAASRDGAGWNHWIALARSGSGESGGESQGWQGRRRLLRCCARFRDVTARAGCGAGLRWCEVVPAATRALVLARVNCSSKANRPTMRLLWQAACTCAVSSWPRRRRTCRADCYVARARVFVCSVTAVGADARGDNSFSLVYTACLCIGGPSVFR